MPHRGQWTLEVNMSGGRKSDLSKRFRRAQGFSLIELLIVVAVILIIAAIAIPTSCAQKMAANESAAVSSIHSSTLRKSPTPPHSDGWILALLTDLGPAGGAILITNWRVEQRVATCIPTRREVPFPTPPTPLTLIRSRAVSPASAAFSPTKSLSRTTTKARLPPSTTTRFSKRLIHPIRGEC